MDVHSHFSWHNANSFCCLRCEWHIQSFRHFTSLLLISVHFDYCTWISVNTKLVKWQPYIIIALRVKSGCTLFRALKCIKPHLLLPSDVKRIPPHTTCIKTIITSMATSQKIYWNDFFTFTRSVWYFKQQNQRKNFSCHHKNTNNFTFV
jgi:hypothetical protein